MLLKKNYRLACSFVCPDVSWGDDEDFGLLVDALAQYDAKFSKTSAHWPRLLVLITGRGAQVNRVWRLLKQKRERKELMICLVVNLFFGRQSVIVTWPNSKQKM